MNDRLETRNRWSVTFRTAWSGVSKLTERFRHLLLVAALVLVALVADRTSGLLSSPSTAVGTVGRDIVGDMIFAEAAWSGVDPYQPVEQLSPEVAGRSGLWGWPSKPPAVASLMAPLLLAKDVTSAAQLFTGISIGAFVALVAVAARVVGARSGPWLALTPLLAASHPARQGFFFANSTFLIALLVLLSWLLAQRGDLLVYGVPLGLAASLRLWPLLLIVPLYLNGRRRVGWGSLIAATTATLVGLAIMDFRVRSAWSGLTSAAAYWRNLPGNASLVGILDVVGLPQLAVWVIPLLATLLVYFVRRSDLNQSFSWLIVGGLILSPLSWAHYSLVALPVLGLAWRAQRARPLLVIAVAILATNLLTVPVFVGRVVLLSAAAVWIASARRSDPVTAPGVVDA